MEIKLLVEILWEREKKNDSVYSCRKGGIKKGKRFSHRTFAMRNISNNRGDHKYYKRQPIVSKILPDELSNTYK